VSGLLVVGRDSHSVDAHRKRLDQRLAVDVQQLRRAAIVDGEEVRMPLFADDSMTLTPQGEKKYG